MPYNKSSVVVELFDLFWDPGKKQKEIKNLYFEKN